MNTFFLTKEVQEKFAIGRLQETLVSDITKLSLTFKENFCILLL